MISHLPTNIKTSLLALLFTAAFSSGYTQPGKTTQKSKTPDPVPLSERIFFGGDLGLQFGDVVIVDISPLAGYKFTEKLVAGLGITYQYYKDKRFSPAFSTSIYGGRLFSRYFIMENIFAHAEYELLNYDALFVDPYSLYSFKDRITANNVYVGVGYRQPIGGNAAIDLLILYNLNESAQSLYQNPILRMGVVFGI
ncbi:MAG TPA: hypothetical protein P5531_08475 [Bacteroidales bacterium]|nr:hypothetical protein [Bacteroidales bacterium]HSA43872.1 hypothetical protein [Bacteroidales bacterium]